MQKARLKLALNDIEAALEVMEQAWKAAAQKIPQRTLARLAGGMVEVAIASGDLKTGGALGAEGD